MLFVDESVRTQNFSNFPAAAGFLKILAGLTLRFKRNVYTKSGFLRQMSPSEQKIQTKLSLTSVCFWDRMPLQSC